MVAIGEALDVAGGAVEAEYDATVLQTPVGIKQLGADRADAWQGRHFQHPPEPVRRQSFDIVVEKQEKRIARRLRARIRQGGKVERTGLSQHLRAPFQRRQIGQHVRPRAAVIDDDQLAIRARVEAVEAFDASAQQIQPVACRHDHARLPPLGSRRRSG